MCKRTICARLFLPLLCVCLLLSTALPAHAAPAANTAGYALPEGSTVYAESAILVNLGNHAENDLVLYQKQADTVHAPGAMMRYMVAAYALRRIQDLGMDIDTATGVYTVEMFNRYVAGTGVPTANMAFDEMWTVRDLLAASFIQSASDAVTALAYALDGSVEAFVNGMNALAVEIGCDYTHFANLTGLDSLSQYTTARDMYRIIRYAQQFSAFESLVACSQVTVTPTAGGSPHTLVTANSLLKRSSSFYYAPLVYSRTGLSEHEGRTCASVARDGGYEYLVVVMACPEEAAGETGLHYRDTRTLFRWAFNNFTYRTILGKSEILSSVKVNLVWSTDRLNLVPEQELATVVENELNTDQVIKKIHLDKTEIDAPVEKGTVLGRVELIVNVDQKIGEVNLVAAETLNRNWLLYAWSGVAGFFTSIWFWLGIVLLVLMAGGYLALNIVHNRRRRRERLQRVKTKR